MKFRNSVLTLSIMMFCSGAISTAGAQSYHTWISGLGSDSNPCTLPSPCASFTAAENKTNPGGLVSVEYPGDFGFLTINRSITFDGNGIGSVGNNGSNGQLVEIDTNGPAPVVVTLRNLTINGGGTAQEGIWVYGPADVTIDNCLIENFTYAGIEMYGAYAQNIVIRNTVIKGGNFGYRSADGGSAVTASLQNVTVQSASTAAVYDNTGSVEISNSVLTHSGVAVQGDSSVYSYATPASISVEDSMLTLNTTAVCANTGSKIRLENNDIFDNGTGVANCGGQVKTNGNNRNSGNAGGNPITSANVSATALF